MTSGGSAVVLEPLRDALCMAEDGHPHPAVASRAVTPRREAVRDARDFTRLTLQRWGIFELLDDVTLVASELVTNALRHALQPGLTMERPDGPVRISLVRRSSRVVCAVRDPSRVSPVARTPDHVAETGRGLHLVDCFSETWGWQLLDGPGKIVWAAFAVPGDSPSGAPRIR